MMYEDATGMEAAISIQDIGTFKHSIEPLAKTGKLSALPGTVSTQFPE